MYKGITTVAKVSVYRGVASRNAGRQFDRDVIAYAATGTIPFNDYARRFIIYLKNTMHLSGLVAQVKVSSANTNWATAIDAVALTGAERCPRIIETKTTRLPVKMFMSLYDKPDRKYPKQMSIHSGKREPNSPMRRFTDQLVNGMNMYAFRYALPARTPMFGSLVIVCPDGIIEHSHDAVYEPNTGINRPATPRCVKARRASIPDSKKRRLSRARGLKAGAAA